MGLQVLKQLQEPWDAALHCPEAAAPLQQG